MGHQFDATPPSAPPTDYDRQVSFTAYEAANPGTNFRAVDLEAEFNAIERALDETQSRLAAIQREDGNIKNGMVSAESLSADISLGVNEATAWATATVYQIADLVWYDSALYHCDVGHTSTTFAADSGNWRLLADFKPYIDSASTSAANAASSAAAAAADRAAAASSATTASNAATAASADAATASSASTAAADSANSADTDATAAANSATNAGASQTAAAASASTASAAATNAATRRDEATAARDAAQTAQTASELARDEAVTARTVAQSARDQAQTALSGAEFWAGQAQSAVIGSLVHNWNAGSAPTPANDSNSGYSQGSEWYVPATGVLYRCVDATPAAAVWIVIGAAAAAANRGPLYTGWVDDALVSASSQSSAGLINAPAGWTIQRTSTGFYLLVHSLGLGAGTELIGSINPGNPAVSGIVDFNAGATSANQVMVRLRNTQTDTGVNDSFQFIFIDRSAP